MLLLWWLFLGVFVFNLFLYVLLTFIFKNILKNREIRIKKIIDYEWKDSPVFLPYYKNKYLNLSLNISYALYGAFGIFTIFSITWIYLDFIDAIIIVGFNCSYIVLFFISYTISKIFIIKWSKKFENDYEKYNLKNERNFFIDKIENFYSFSKYDYDNVNIRIEYLRTPRSMMEFFLKKFWHKLKKNENDYYKTYQEIILILERYLNILLTNNEVYKNTLGVIIEKETLAKSVFIAIHFQRNFYNKK